MGVSVIHFAVGLLVFREHLPLILQTGWLGGVERDATLGVVTWFMLLSPALMMAGLAIHTIEQQGAALPRSLAWWLLGTAALGVALMPASGFYLVVPPAIAILLRTRRLNTGASHRSTAT